MPRKSMDGVRIHLILTRPQYNRMQKLSEKSGLPMSELMRRAVDTYLGKKK
ncbi:MAG: ribbon-helix-helix domain-containing protein [Gammaproteobacteria bacterium]|nr:ribbon-helix-helix domain-containing protein [Gammaproteobacteria bacterium]